MMPDDARVFLSVLVCRIKRVKEVLTSILLRICTSRILCKYKLFAPANKKAFHGQFISVSNNVYTKINRPKIRRTKIHRRVIAETTRTVQWEVSPKNEQ